MRTALLLSSLLLLVCSCSTAASGSADLSDDASGDTWWHGGNPDSAGQPDLQEEPPADLSEEDLPLANTPPTFATPAPVSLDMGTSTTIDLALLLGDAEDDAAALVVSWSADSVALQEQESHQLLVVAPVNWFGSEVIDLTVTDTGGLTAVAPLKVIVTEVEVIDPPPDKCDPVLFSLEAGSEVVEVLLSGTFNDWGSDPDSATVMSDDDGDDIWTVSLELDPGKHLYKFIVDGEWLPDPDNPDQEDDGYGSFNSILEVAPCEE